MAIQNFQNINDIIKAEGLDICVISYGGSGSNALADTLINNGYNCKTHTWKKILCHCPEIIKIDIPIICIYRNPVHAFLSMKRRRAIWKSNLMKLSNNENIIKTDEALLKLMFRHFDLWVNAKLDNVLYIKYEELFEETIVDKLKGFLKKDDLKHFPLEFVTPKTDYRLKVMDQPTKKLFKKYKDTIDRINNWKF